MSVKEGLRKSNSNGAFPLLRGLEHYLVIMNQSLMLIPLIQTLAAARLCNFQMKNRKSAVLSRTDHCWI